MNAISVALFMLLLTAVAIIIILVRSNQSRNAKIDGDIVIDKTDIETDSYKLILNISFDELDSRDTVRFKIVKK